MKKLLFYPLMLLASVFIVGCNNDEVNDLNYTDPFGYYKPDKQIAMIPEEGGADTIRVSSMNKMSVGTFPLRIVSVEVYSNGKSLSVQQRDSTLFTGAGFSVLSTKSPDPKLGYVILSVDKELSRAGYEMKVILDKYSKNMETAWTFIASRHRD